MALDLFCHPHSAGILLHSQPGAGRPEWVRMFRGSCREKEEEGDEERGAEQDRWIWIRLEALPWAPL